MKTLILGVKRMQGIGKNSNKPFDFTRVYVAQPLPDDADLDFVCGIVPIEVDAPSDIIPHIRKLHDSGQLPAMAELNFEQRFEYGQLKSMLTTFKLVQNQNVVVKGS